jgi:hypothetical protein
MFRRKLLPPLKGRRVICAAFLIYPEDGANRFLRNTGKHLPDYTASHPRGEYSSK